MHVCNIHTYAYTSPGNRRARAAYETRELVRLTQWAAGAREVIDQWRSIRARDGRAKTEAGRRIVRKWVFFSLVALDGA